MSNILLLARRELAAFMKTSMGYVIIAIVLFIDGIIFNVFALGGSPKLSAAVLENFYHIATFMSVVAGLLFAMRLLAEEKQLGTITLLLTSPVKEYEIVAGKFLAALVFFVGMTVLSIYMPLLIFVNGKVSFGHIFAGYLGLSMVGMLSIAVGMFASSLTRIQVLAAVIGGALMAFIYFSFFIGQEADPPLRNLISFLSWHRRMSWQGGIIRSSDVFYYCTASYFFLLMTVHVLRARRWR